MIDAKTTRRFGAALVPFLATCALIGQQPTFDELKRDGAARSSYRSQQPRNEQSAVPEPDLDTFRREIEPILSKTCYRCHGPKKQKGDVRIDTLDADLFHGGDVEWWLDVLGALTNAEMPPDEDDLSDDDRAKVIDWLSSESQLASTVRRATAKHSSFRRLTRYEYDYALQDLLGLPFDFAEELPPDPTSEDGFQNSSEVLHLNGVQFRAHLDSARDALRLATVAGERPAPLFWSLAMERAAERDWKRQDNQLAKARKKHAKNPKKQQQELAKLQKNFARKPGRAYFLQRSTGRMAQQSWGYNGAKHAWKPTDAPTAIADRADTVAVVPPKQTLIVELGDRLPERGTLRVRVRAARATDKGERLPSLQLIFGWQASNDSRANVVIDDSEQVLDGKPGAMQTYEWRLPMSQVYPRNLVRGINKLGDLPSPSEYLKFRNAAPGGGDVLIAHVEVAAPIYEQWPPASHRRLFADVGDDERQRAEALVRRFATRAWRRDVRDEEVERKLRLFDTVRPQCDSYEDAMREVLASVLSSPNFLYLSESDSVATRLATFLWCSTPDDELLQLQRDGRLGDKGVIQAQVARMLRDERTQRFAKQFVRQWLAMAPLDYLHIDRKVHRSFDEDLRAAMRRETVAFFQEVLDNDLSVLEFVHSDFAMVNERLAKHYGIDGVFGSHFRRVALDEKLQRGGVLTHAGLLAMNSDGIDSHPLKRGVWMLERMLNDPPPPPPPAVPEIDLADPRIAKMTLKQRIEDHRNHAACMSCHQKIDPWGIAFENFDAVGRWRTSVQGKPVDASSKLFNDQVLDGMDGLKRYLLTNRQDQLVRALVYKLTTFALGRPLTFSDRAAIDEITANVRSKGDGLATMITEIATSSLFTAN